MVGNPRYAHVGSFLLRAAQDLGLEVRCADTAGAFGAGLRQRVAWWLGGRRPVRLTAFSEGVRQLCASWRPNWLLATGLAPLGREDLDSIGRRGVLRLNFQTDDPWNPAHRATWFLDALPGYDWVFNTRRANLADLQRAGCGRVRHCWFGYAPEVHYPEVPGSRELQALSSDVLFAGGADRDRVPPIEALIASGLSVRLHGGYWERHRRARRSAFGMADGRTLRRTMAATKVALCLVRRANRDGHVMRSFEVPAMGACPLLEDTPEHRELFGAEGEAALYFTGEAELVERARWLVAREDERRRLAAAAHRLITTGPHRYQDRLVEMLALASGATS